MRVAFITIMIAISCHAEYKTAKIDMHGGKNYSKYGNFQSSFGKKSMGFSALLDNNSSKKSKEKKVKNN